MFQASFNFYRNCLILLYFFVQLHPLNYFFKYMVVINIKSISKLGPNHNYSFTNIFVLMRSFSYFSFKLYASSTDPLQIFYNVL